MTDTPVLITAQELHDRLDDPRLRTLDATHFLRGRLPDDEELYPRELSSGREAYERRHIPGAAYVDLAADLSRQDTDVPLMALDSEDFARRIGELGVGDDSWVVIYDHGETEWATRVQWNLALEGFDRASVLDGGLPQWVAAGFETASGIEEHPPTTFTARRRPERYATKEDVQATMDDPDTVLIDGLPEADFLGQTEHYGRPGHIPGARNVPFASLQDERQTAVSEDAVRRRLEEAGIEIDPSKRYITQCGGGVAATYVAMHLNRVGLEDVRVYDGSLAEWNADPTTAVVNPSEGC